MYHAGIDFAVPAGVDVFVSHDGLVATTGSDPNFGNYVVSAGNRLCSGHWLWGVSAANSHFHNPRVSALSTATAEPADCFLCCCTPTGDQWICWHDPVCPHNFCLEAPRQQCHGRISAGQDHY